MGWLRSARGVDVGRRRRGAAVAARGRSRAGRAGARAGAARQRGALRRPRAARRSRRPLPARLRPRRGERRGADRALPRRQRGARRLEIARHDYAIERIDGLPPRQVAPSAEDLVRIEADARLIDAARQRDSAEPGVARDVRLAGGRARSAASTAASGSSTASRAGPHRGVDIAAPEGTPVGAMADGVVSLAAPAMYFTGGTVMIDHGYGLHSIYAHLSEVAVAVGQAVRPRRADRPGRRHRPRHRARICTGACSGSSARSTRRCWSARCRSPERRAVG